MEDLHLVSLLCHVWPFYRTWQNQSRLYLPSSVSTYAREEIRNIEPDIEL